MGFYKKDIPKVREYIIGFQRDIDRVQMQMNNLRREGYDTSREEQYIYELRDKIGRCESAIIDLENGRELQWLNI